MKYISKHYLARKEISIDLYYSLRSIILILYLNSCKVKKLINFYSDNYMSGHYKYTLLLN